MITATPQGDDREFAAASLRARIFLHARGTIRQPNQQPQSHVTTWLKLGQILARLATKATRGPYGRENLFSKAGRAMLADKLSMTERHQAPQRGMLGGGRIVFSEG